MASNAENVSIWWRHHDIIRVLSVMLYWTISLCITMTPHGRYEVCGNSTVSSTTYSWEHPKKEKSVSMSWRHDRRTVLHPRLLIDWVTFLTCCIVTSRCGSTLAPIMACCLKAPSHYLNRCWLIANRVLWNPLKTNFTGLVQVTFRQMRLKNAIIKLFPYLTAACELHRYIRCMSLRPQKMLIQTQTL